MSEQQQQPQTGQGLLTRNKPPKLVRVPWLELNAKGRPVKGSMMNVQVALAALKIECRYDIFLNQYVVAGRDMGRYVGELDDKIARAVREYMFMRTKYEPGVAAAREGLMRACEEHTFNSIIDYLNGLKWDGVPRVDKWLTTYVGVEDTPLHSEYGRLVLFAACRRAFEPGCKWDHVLSLEGGEGKDKSTLVKVMAGAKDPEGICVYFSDSTILDKDEKQQMELLAGVWFYELSEMAGLPNADKRKVKAFVVRQEDRARAAYAYFRSRQPRSSIMIATINTDPVTGEIVEYLNPGDLRRWWPVGVGHIDIPALIRDRDQLFAEAMARARTLESDELGEVTERWASLKLPEKFWKLARVEQIEREVSDPIADRLASLFSILKETRLKGTNTTDRTIDKQTFTAGRDFIVSGGEVWVSRGMVTRLLPPAMSNQGNRIAAVMASLGWWKTNDRRTGVQCRGFERSGAADDIAEDAFGEA